MRLSIIFIILITGSSLVSAQGNLDKQASNLIEKGRYIEALEALESFNKDDKSYFLKRGICYFHTSQLDKALNDLSTAFEKGENSGVLLKYLAKTHHLKGEFYEAARAYKLYLNEIDRKDPERKAIVHAIKNCNYGRKALYRDQQGFVENIGKEVNSPYDDIAPVRSPNFESKYYYSSNKMGSTGGLRNEEGLKDDAYGNYAHDIYAVEKVNGKWTQIAGVPPLLNSARDEIIQGFNDNGKVIIFLKAGRGKSTELVADTFSTDLNSRPFPLYTPANAALGDKDLFFINDSTFLYSSKRKGGFGGYDIYITFFKDGNWKNPVNLGPEINSPFDEETPFLSNSNTVIYFSSNRVESMGGYDIFSANYGIERGKWLPAENMGIPFSSPGNDKYFQLSPDGRSALLSSDRKESLGGYDLFIAYLKTQVYEQLTDAVSIPFLSRMPSNKEMASTESPPNLIKKDESSENTYPSRKREIVIKPLFYETSEVLSNGNNAKFLKDLLDMMIIFPELKAIFTGHTHYGGSKGYDLYFSIKSAEQVSTYLESNGISRDRLAVYGTGSNYPMVKSIGSNLATKNNNRIEVKLSDDTESGLAVTYTYPVVNEYLKDQRAEAFRTVYDGIIFRVAAAEANQMYDNPQIVELDNVIVEKDPDKETYIYTVGNCTTYQQALDLKNILISRGIEGVKMNVYHDGIKMNVEQIQSLREGSREIDAYITNELR